MVNLVVLHRSVPCLILALFLLIISLASLVKLIYVQWRVLPEHARARPFPRMLQSLACASIMASLAGVPLVVGNLYLPVSWTGASSAMIICDFLSPALRMTRLVVILQETHLAMTFLAQSIRWTSVFPVLHRAIPAVWFGGFALGLWDVLSYDIDDVINHKDVTVCLSHDMGMVSLVTMCVCVCLSFVSCIASLVRSRSDDLPDSVQRRNYRRAAGYMLVILVSYPWMVIARKDHEVGKVFFGVSMAMECCSGFMNSMTYFVQSRQELARHRTAKFAQADNRLHNRKVRQAVMDVGFGGVDTMELLYSTASSTDSFPPI